MNDSGLSQSVEDYLETMYCLQRDKGKIKVKDISEALNVKPPSVVEAVQKLSQMDMVTYQRYREIKLTPKGIENAKNVMQRHRVLEEFLDILGVELETREEDACAMEHVLSNPTIDNLKSFAEFMHIYPDAEQFLKDFQYYRETGHLQKKID